MAARISGRDRMNPENACVVCLNSMKELLTQRRRYGAVNIQGESPNSITLNYAHRFLLRKISRPKSTNIVPPITNPITTEFIFISRQFFPSFSLEIFIKDRIEFLNLNIEYSIPSFSIIHVDAFKISITFATLIILYY